MSSLVPEKPLLVSPSLAATIGLEEATMLSVLSDLFQHRQSQFENGFSWLKLDQSVVAQCFPFWTDHDVQRIAKNLCDKGVLLLRSAPFIGSRTLDFAFNEQTTFGEQANSSEQPNSDRVNDDTIHTDRFSPSNIKPHNVVSRGANRIALNWQPSDDTLTQVRQKGIEISFAMEQVPEFIAYWRERDEAHFSWGAKFLGRVVREWRNHETEFHRKDRASAINASWQPSEDAMEVLVKHASISREFVEDAIPEFVLFWQERGDSSKTWNSKFIQHVRRQWNRYTATIENETVPKPIPENWQPGEDVFDVLRLANIDITFAKKLVTEFVMFWRDCGQVAGSWNTKFLQHTKYHWAKSHQPTANPTGSTNQSINYKTRDRSLVDDLTDRSWAF